MDKFHDIIDQIKAMDLSDKARDLFNAIAASAKALGRVTTKQLLLLYYVMKEGDLSPKQIVLIFASIAYVVLPNDLIPRRVFHFLGLTDDIVALVYVVNQIQDHITPEISQKVDVKLGKWFGYEVGHVGEDRTPSEN